jgi:hypothetical protein
MIRSAAAIGLAALVTTFAMTTVACGGPDKPPMTPDGPDMTAPVGGDAGVTSASIPPSPAVEEMPSAPGSPKGGIETQTSIGGH